MENHRKLAVIGLDTSHSVEFPKLIQDPAVQEDLRISGFTVTRALRFPSAFQSEEGQNKRQEYLESIGVQVTRSFDEAVADCEALLIMINDPALHLEYFEKCAGLGKPVFLDKPMADSWQSALKIVECAEKNNIRFFTSSALRYDADFAPAAASWGKAASVTTYGPIGKAAAGSSVIWYGCHTVEMLQTAMGRGAVAVSASRDMHGFVFHVIYADGRRGVVDMSDRCWKYGACCRDENNNLQSVVCTFKIPFYHMLLKEIRKFFDGGEVLPLKDELEVIAILDACDRAAASGKVEPVYNI